jgi:hypothetical protein
VLLRAEAALLLDDRRNRRLGRRPGHKKAIVMAELKPDEEFMIVEALYPLCGAGTPRCPARVRKFFPPYDQEMENIAKRIESRSGDPNMQAISTHGK